MAFNQLTPAQAERLAKLAEEASEVVQACMKILRHGYNSHDPDNHDLGNNAVQLWRELGNMKAAINLMKQMGDPVDFALIDDFAHTHTQDLKRYMHHQD